ncbi:MAG: ABC transporter permease [Bacteroidia bacterium]|nr:ABC transporter permease [Bacteroidia bacterium]
MFLHYLKIIFRDIRQNGFRFILTSLGIAVGLVIFSFAYFLMFQAQGKGVSSFKHHDRIVQMVNHNDEEKEFPFTAADLERVMQLQLPAIESVAAISGARVANYINIEQPNGEFLPHATSWMRVANAGFFDVFGADFIHGGNQQWGDNTAVLSKSFAKKLFGNANPVGKNVELTDETHHIFATYRVTGVIKDIQVDAMGGDIYLSDAEQKTAPFVFALLRNKKDANGLNNSLKTLQRVSESDNQLLHPQLKFVSQKRSLFDEADPLAVGILVLSLLVLFSALINFFNLLANSFVVRIRQFTLRKIVGATHFTLFRQLLYEVIPVLALSVLLAFAFTELLIPRLTKLSGMENFPGLFLRPEQIYFIQLWTVVVITALSMITILIFLKKTGKVVASEGIRGYVTGKPGNKLLRNISLAIQLLFAFFLLSSTFLLFNYNQKIAAEGKTALARSNPKTIFAVPLLDFTLPNHQQEILRKINSIGGVEDVLQMGAFMPLGESFDNEMQSYFMVQSVYTLPDSTEIPIAIVSAEPNFFSLFNIDTKGLDIASLAPNEAVASKSFVERLKDFPSQESIDLGGGIYRIAGVVDGIPFAPPAHSGIWVAPPIPDMSPGVYVKSSKGSEANVRKELLSVIRTYVPESIPYKIENLSENQERRSGYPSVFNAIIWIVSFFSLVIALFGIYTAITVDTRKKQKNVAIRKINGAVKKDIYWLFAKIYVLLLGISFILSSVFIVWIWSNQLMEAPVAYRPNITVVLLWTFIIIGFFVITVMFGKLNRISKTNPAEVVKSE